MSILTPIATTIGYLAITLVVLGVLWIAAEMLLKYLAYTGLLGALRIPRKREKLAAQLVDTKPLNNWLDKRFHLHMHGLVYTKLQEDMADDFAEAIGRKMEKNEIEELSGDVSSLQDELRDVHARIDELEQESDES